MAIKSSRAASATTKYISTQGGTASYATAAQLPFSGNNVGDRAVLTDTNKLYLWNGNGWFEMVTATSDLTITQPPAANYTLAQDGTATEITLAATGTGTIEWGYYFNRPVNDAVTVTNVGNVFTITPSTDFNKNGAYKITFYAKNETNVANVQTVVTVNNPPVGQAEFITPGTYTWTAPDGVTSVSAVAVGGGGGGKYYKYGGAGGGGGGLGWKNNIPVIPGETYAVVVGSGGNGINTDGTAGSGGDSYFNLLSTVAGYGGTGGYGHNGVRPAGGSYIGDGGGNGGSGYSLYGSAGGAGGYSGPGGSAPPGYSYPGNPGSGGGGGSGGSGYEGGGGGGGGGVGIYGEGNSGAGGASRAYSATHGAGGGGGSGGTSGIGGTTYTIAHGGNFGGGGGGYAGQKINSGSGGGGAVRIIWGPNRAFPSTNTADM